MPVVAPVIPIELTESSWQRITRPPRACDGADPMTNLKQVDAWWSVHPHSQIAIVTGGASPIVAVFAPSASAIARKTLGRSPDVTSSGGEAYFYLQDHEDAKPLKNIDGVDIRANGDLVLAPPSLNVLGSRLTWAPRIVDITHVTSQE